DQFGVSEPSIQKQGHNRIIIELAGITDRKRALELVGKTARLEFRLLKEPQVAQRVASRINEYLMGQVSEEDTSKVLAETKEATKDTTKPEGLTEEALLGQTTSEDTTAITDTTALAQNENEFGESLFFASGRGLSIPELMIPRFHKVLEDPKVQEIIQQEAGDAELLLGKIDPRVKNLPADQRYVPVYLVNAKPELTGETIVDAVPRVGSASDPNAFGRFETDLTFNEQGARDFARVTGANVGKPLAIILDGKVHSAPVIRDKIRNGRARITGLESIEEAKDLAIVLKAGALPAPAKIIEERTVGPSLGKDSVEQGYKSAVLGLILVALFMMVYYKFSGFVADIALVLNVLLLLGIMATLHATLTLPGIAGIILTIGMSVDANVLIFERIREELAVGKSVWASLETGYSRAFLTIWDANITTFIAAVVLYNFGSGPIRGFATTLMIGILASMFTAIFVTRTIFEFLLSKKILKQMSI
ncbi:MAG: protein translocase subunit SecD, partial [Calditrichaeota bacterium]